MGWATVETPHAKYVIGFEFHLRQARFPVGQVDGLILEGVTTSHYEWSKEEKEIGWLQSTHKKVIENAAQSKTPIYGGDYHTPMPLFPKLLSPYGIAWLSALAASQVKNTLKPVLFIGVLDLASMAPSYSLVPGQKIAFRKPLVLIASGMEKLRRKLKRDSGLDVPFRNAIIAEKAEGIIAPHLRQQLGRKPVIGILYGAMHVELLHLLKNRTARRRILARLHLEQYRIRRDSEDVTKVIEFRFNPAKQELQPHLLEPEIHVPVYKPPKKRWQARMRLARMKVKRAFHH